MIELYQGDCLEVMKGIESGSIDAIITDPPYGTTACKWDSVIPLEPMWEHLKRIIKPNGAIILFGSQPFTSVLICSNLKMFKYELIWDKVSGGNIFNAKLSPMKTHENMLIFSYGKTSNGNKNNMEYYPIMEDAATENIRPINKGSKIGDSIYDDRKLKKQAKSTHNYNPKKRYPKSIIKISKYTGSANSTKRLHPTQKPVALMEYLIKTYTNEGETVLDFTMGSGTAGVAAIKNGRSFIGIEKDPEYFKIAENRIKQAEHQLTF